MKLTELYKHSITGSAIRDYFKSKFLLWCNHHAPLSEKDPESEYMKLLEARGRKFETYVIEKDYPGLKKIEVKDTEEILPLLREGEDAIDNITLAYHDLLGIPDLLVKNKGKSKLGDFHYIVKEIKSAKTIKKYHVMQAIFYNFILGKLQGLTPENVFLINGEEKETAYDYKDYEPELLEALEDIKKIIKGKKIEPVIGAPYPWENYGEKLAKEQQDISLVQGISEATRERFIHAGFKTIKKIADASEEELVQIESIGDSKAKRIKLSAQALLSGKPIILGSQTSGSLRRRSSLILSPRRRMSSLESVNA